MGTKPTAERKRPRVTPKSARSRAPVYPLDERSGVLPRMFELMLTHSEGDPAFHVRMRVLLRRAGGIVANTQFIDGERWLIGSFSESMGGKKWSSFGHGMVPFDSVFSFRELAILEETGHAVAGT